MKGARPAMLQLFLRCLFAILLGIALPFPGIIRTGAAESLALDAEDANHSGDAAQDADRRLYQEALFHFYRNDYLHTLVLLENDFTGTNHLDNEFHNRNHLLAVEAALRLGMLDSAAEILKHLAFTAREQRVQQQARFYKAKLAYLRKDWRGVISELGSTLAALPTNLRDEAIYYQANSHLRSNQSVEAARVLGGISRDSLWGAYGYFNLGAAYVNRERSPSKALVAFRVAATFTDASEEGLELKDHINLEAGRLALSGNEPEKAMGFLQDVRASGTAAPAAILDYGLAQAALGRQRTAIQTWYRAKIFGLVVPGVADSFLSIAYGYEKEKLRGTAIDAYMEAIGAYEKELRHTSEIDGELRKEGVLALLTRVQSDDSSVEWFLASELAANTPRVVFAFYLMNDPDFFAGARRLLELNTAVEGVARGSQRLEALQSVLQKRIRGALKSAPSKAVVSLDEAGFKALVERRNALVADYRKLAEGPSKQAAAAEIRGLDGELRILGKRYRSVAAKVADARGFYEGQLRQVSDLASRFALLHKDLRGEIATIDQQLTTQALALLDKHREYIDDYYVRSQLALVNLHDETAVAELQKSAEVQGMEPGGAP